MRTSRAFLHTLLLLLLVGCLFGLMCPAQAQQLRKVVQFTGLVVYGDSSAGVASALVSVPGSHRTTLTNAAGYFSLPVLAGDNVAVRFHEQVQYIAIPADLPGQSYSAVVQLPDVLQVLPIAPIEFQGQFLSLPPASASYYDVRPVFYDPNSLKDTFRQLLKNNPSAK